MPTTPIELVLLDLDGVIRHFDPAWQAAVEREHDLSAGVLASTAFGSPLIQQVVTGQITRAEWTTHIGELVGSPAAAQAWLADPGRVDDEILESVDTLRGAGHRVAVLTNGTDTISAELDRFGVTSRFDAIFNTADIGHAKPDRRAFDHVCSSMRVEPPAVFFADDSVKNIDGAGEFGMQTHHFTGVPAWRTELVTLGLLPPSDQSSFSNDSV